MRLWLLLTLPPRHFFIVNLTNNHPHPSGSRVMTRAHVSKPGLFSYILVKVNSLVCHVTHLLRAYYLCLLIHVGVNINIM